MTHPSVLVFAGLDPSGGAGIQADIQAISAAGAHPLPIVTALTVQDNEHVQEVHPVEPGILRAQAGALVEAGIVIAALKIGIVGSAANAQAIAAIIADLRQRQPDLPVVLDPVLASGHGDMLTRGDAVAALVPLRKLATIITPNLPELAALCVFAADEDSRAHILLAEAPHLLLKGGHGDGDQVINRWYCRRQVSDPHQIQTKDGASDSHGELRRAWQWPRLPGGFHGSGCTLASALAARLAMAMTMEAALDQSQHYTQSCLARAFNIARGQSIPHRIEDIR